MLQDEFAALCFDRLGIAAGAASSAAQSLKLASLRWFRHEAVQRVFLGQFIAEQLARREMPACMDKMGGRTLLPDIALAVAERAGAIDMLERFVATDPKHAAVAMAVSVLLRVNPEWRPAGRCGAESYCGLAVLGDVAGRRPAVVRASPAPTLPMRTSAERISRTSSHSPLDSTGRTCAARRWLAESCRTPGSPAPTCRTRPPTKRISGIAISPTRS